MLANRIIYRPEGVGYNFDPHHDTVPIIGGAQCAHSADAVRQMVLSMAGSYGLDVGLVEASRTQVESFGPVVSCLQFIVAFVQMQSKFELGSGIHVIAYPFDEIAKRSGVRVR